MKQEQITKAINESSIGKFFHILNWVVLIFAIIFTIVFIRDIFVLDCYEKGECDVLMPVKCNLELLNCYVIDKDIEDRMSQNSSIGGGARPIIMEHEFCGYGEASAWLEQYSKMVGGNLYLECN